MIVKQCKAIIFALVMLFCFGGCSPRYIKYKRAVRRVQSNEITSEQFDEKFYKFYKTRKVYSSLDTTLPIKFNGSYVNQDTDGKFRVYKFLPDGKVTGTWKMNVYPNNISVLSITTEHHYYKIEGNSIEIEYLQSRDWKLYNIVKRGRITGDTIVFYQTENMQIPWSKPTKINDVYVYDKSLTASP